jgi:N-acetyl-gamma-glutamyl-phosphate reductase
MNVGIINGTSYFGVELVRLIANHSEFTVTSVTARSQAGSKFGDVFPHLQATDPDVARLVLTKDLDKAAVDLIFSCLPHGVSAKTLAPYVDAGIPIIDVSADFRLKDPAEYARWYQVEHPSPNLLSKAVYGLTELHRDEIRKATIVGNPGCYSTAAILALTPAFRAGIIERDVIIDAKSGVSGSGRTLNLDSHYSEVNESLHAYAVNGHRHGAEMRQELSLLAGGSVAINFVPHLVPMTRGILATCYATLSWPVDNEEIASIYQDFCSDEPFLLFSKNPPRTKTVVGSNYCAIHATIDQTGRRLIAFGAIDNLVKGAAGQALQNANLMLGLPETSGLNMPPQYP